MRLGVRATLFLASVAVITLSTIVAYLYLRTELLDTLRARLRDEVEVQAVLIAHSAASVGSLDDVAVWDALADSAGRTAHARVTIIRADGAVLGDSETSVHNLSALRRDADGPDVRAALAPRATRFQPTSRETDSMLFVAVPFDRDDRRAGAVRLRVPVNELLGETARLRSVVGIGFLLALGVAVVMSSLAAELSSRAARELTSAARKMAEGNLSTRTGIVGTDEMAALGGALDQLAQNLSQTVGELRAERDRLHAVLTGMREGLLLLDKERKVALVNPALREMLLLGTNVEGKSPLEVIRHVELVRLLDSAGTTKEVVSGEIELTGLKPRRLLVHVVPLAGVSRGLLAVFVDVTHLRKLEAMRRDFVANASHELRTPIAAVQSAAETLQAGAADDPAAMRQFLQIIARNADRLRSLVDDLLELSRIEAQEVHIELEIIELSSVLRGAVELFQERARKKGITLSCAVEPPDLRALSDRRAIEHVLVNLVDNAVKYCPAGAKVDVRARREKDLVLLTVSDTGPGIPSTHLPRLFERFYRVDPGRSRELGGTGLGLSIVKHLVEVMGGTVHVESTVGAGTTFVVSLSAGIKRTAAALPAAAPPETSLH